MTAYHGGKQRIGREIAQAIYDVSTCIADRSDVKIKGYCEPFCGMLGVYRHIPDLFEDTHKLKYKAGDINKSVVLMWKAAQKGWIPPTKFITKEEFSDLKNSSSYSALKGFVGHVYTYRGVFFDGYFRHSSSKIKHNSDSVYEIGQKLKNVTFSPGNYEQYSNLKNYVIYCDPPYKNTEQRYYTGNKYKDRLTFDNDKFWDWCREMSRNNIIFVSEYSAPKGIKSIWKKDKEKLYLI